VFGGHDLDLLSSVTCRLDFRVAISWRCSIVIKSLSPAIFEIMGTKHIGVTTLTFRGHVTTSVTWPFDSQWPFPIGGPLSPSFYLQPNSRYWPPSVLGSRPWPFRVTWPHRLWMWQLDSRSRDGPFPTGGPLDPSLYL